MYTLDLLILVAGFSALLGLAGGILAALLWAWEDRASRERAKMAEMIRELEEKIEALKEDAPKRHTHSTTLALEDALSIAIDLLEEHESSERYIRARTGQLLEILRQARLGPFAYEEQPAGKRPKRRHEDY